MTAIAFIGLGTMGAPMAKNLIKAGHRLAVYDVSPAAMNRFTPDEARHATSPADAARGVSVVITMLPTTDHVRAALFDADGATATLAPSALVIEMSTIAPAGSLAIAERVQAMGARFMDAPVGRTPRDAENGTLLVMAGGAVADFAEAKPLFEAMADTIFHVGPLGHGIKLKVVNNYMAMVGMLMTAETLTLAAKAGLDRAMVVKVLSNTTAGRGQLIVNYPKKVLAGDITPDFPLKMGLKDISLALELGGELGSPLALGGVAREFFGLAKSWGRADQDCTAMLLLLEDLAVAAGGATASRAKDSS